MAIRRIKSIRDYEDKIKKDPRIIERDYEDELKKDPSIIQNELDSQNKKLITHSLDILSTKLNYLRGLYYFAAYEAEKFNKYLTHLSILIGWGINLFTIIVTSYDSDITDDVVTIINSLGNLLSVIVITLVNFFSLHEKIFIYRNISSKIDGLQREIDIFSHCYITQEYTREKLKDEYQKFFGRYLGLQQDEMLTISIKTKEKYNKIIGRKIVYDLLDNLLTDTSKYISEDKDKNNQQNEKINKQNEKINEENQIKTKEN